MTDTDPALPWLVIRQDDNGNRYRVGSFATRADAERAADQLDARGHRQFYLVEHIDRASA